MFLVSVTMTGVSALASFFFLYETAEAAKKEKPIGRPIVYAWIMAFCGLGFFAAASVSRPTDSAATQHSGAISELYEKYSQGRSVLRSVQISRGEI